MPQHSLRFLLDVNIPEQVRKCLEQSGHDCQLVRDINPCLPDTKIFSLAREQQRIILTSDKDFVMLSRFHSHNGILLLRSKTQSPLLKIEMIENFLETTQETLYGKVVILQYE